MTIFKKSKGSRESHPEPGAEVQAELSTILLSVSSRLEQLERRLEALEETIAGVMGSTTRASALLIRERLRKTRQHSARELKRLELGRSTPKAKEPTSVETKLPEKTDPAKIIRGKPIRPFKKED